MENISFYLSYLVPDITGSKVGLYITFHKKKQSFCCFDPLTVVVVGDHLTWQNSKTTHIYTDLYHFLIALISFFSAEKISLPLSYLVPEIYNCS